MIQRPHITFAPSQQEWINKKMGQAVGLTKRLKKEGATPEQYDNAVVQFLAAMNLEFAKMGRTNTDGR